MTADAATGRRMLSPVRSRTVWTVSGLAVQAAGLGVVTAFVWAKLRHQDIGGHITAATFRLIWHEEVHTRTGMAVFITGAIIYAAGSILLARPHVSRPVTLFIAVPVAAVAGMVVLGALALAVACLISALHDPLDVGMGGAGGGHGRRRRRQGQRSRVHWPWFLYL
ncbi:MAG: hypothetical protein JO244_09285 [Solirubrobacterales bacterium]|nr:hypothetical protein [Solirubrobacterales bacterium]